MQDNEWCKLWHINLNSGILNQNFRISQGMGDHREGAYNFVTLSQVISCELRLYFFLLEPSNIWVFYICSQHFPIVDWRDFVEPIMSEDWDRYFPDGIRNQFGLSGGSNYGMRDQEASYYYQVSTYADISILAYSRL